MRRKVSGGSTGRAPMPTPKACMLFNNTSNIDLQGSRAFLDKLGIGSVNDGRNVRTVLEAGAGQGSFALISSWAKYNSIGRVIEGLLSNITEHIDVIEPIKWQPLEGVHYDLIWTQGAQLIKYLKHCKAAVTPETGIIVLKENLSSTDEDYVDPVDGSVTRCCTENRSEITFQEIIREAGLRVIRMETQHGLPRVQSMKLFPVKMYAMKPHRKEITA
ncbi:hypothetical protein PG997_012187 [Apiospora hydei]|uniref:Alpha N-terminal protein methyltransferase 1 n=1 Tax=Apiospora hydei TaxID=1337664 RepID=A0ABR1V2L9_9PEZI